jgi:hypothetical protein
MTSTEATRTLDKVVSPGTVDVGRDQPVDVFARIQYDGARLSITGVEGPRRNGDAWGSTGQIAMGYAHRDESDNDQRYDEPSRIEEWADGRSGT